MVELEALALGVNGKLALWRSLRELETPASVPSATLSDLIGRAQRQLEEIESHRSRAAAEALS